MPSESKQYRSKRYGPLKDKIVDTGTNTVPYGPGANDHPPDLPTHIDVRDESRAAEAGGLRSWYKTRNWPDRVDQSALAKIRMDLLHPRVTSK